MASATICLAPPGLGAGAAWGEFGDADAASWRLNDGQDDPDECDDPDCACHEDAGHPRPGDGAAEVTMTEVYDPDAAY